MPEQQEKELQRFLDYEGVVYILDELQRKLDKKANIADIVPYILPTATANRLGGIKVGSGLKSDEDGVVSLDGELNATVEWDEVLNKPTSLAGMGILDGATKEELDELEQKITRAYHHGGNVETVADLTLIEDPVDGAIYIVQENGNTYAWNETKQTWDNLGPLINLSDYMEALTIYDLDVIMGTAKSAKALKDILENRDEVVLKDNIYLEEPVIISQGKSVTIDLNGQSITTDQPQPFLADGGTITFTGEGTINVNGEVAHAINGGQIIVQNGTYDSATDIPFRADGSGCKVTVNGGTLTGQESVVMAYHGAAIEVNGGSLSARDNFAVGTNGKDGWGNNTIILNDGILTGNITSPGYEAIGVYIANNDTFIMNGGEIIANDGAGICMRAGHVVINGGTIIATGTAGTTGKIGDNKTAMSKSGIIYHQTANYPGYQQSGMLLEVKGGTIIGVDHSIEVISNEQNPQVSVTGGTFNPPYPET